MYFTSICINKIFGITCILIDTKFYFKSSIKAFSMYEIVQNIIFCRLQPIMFILQTCTKIYTYIVMHISLEWNSLWCKDIWSQPIGVNEIVQNIILCRRQPIWMFIKLQTCTKLYTYIVMHFSLEWNSLWCKDIWSQPTGVNDELNIMQHCKS